MNISSRIRHNVYANFLGKLWISFFGIIFVPIYIRLLGIESYGLIGLFVSLTSIVSLLDMGLSTTLSREISILSINAKQNNETGDIVRTLEIIYIFIGFLIGFLILSLSGPISNYWIDSSALDKNLIKNCIVIMGISISFNWPSSLYIGGLIGLQRQIDLNLIRSIFASMQYIGAVIILIYFSKSVFIFFVWQSFVSLISTISLRIWLWKILEYKSNHNFKPKFKFILIKRIFKFASGVTGISILTVLLTQIDKIILSRMLSLEFFGYYMVAFNISEKLNYLVSPIVTALYPRFTQLISKGSNDNLLNLYNIGSQLVSVIVIPCALTLAFFSREILYLWLRDIDLSNNTYLILSVFIIGTALNNLVSLPYTLQLAYGKTKLVFFANLFAVFFLIPFIIFLTNLYQGVGAVIPWLTLNFGYFIFLIPKMHIPLFKLGMQGWYKNNVNIQLLISLLIIITAKFFIPKKMLGLDLTIFVILISLFIAYLCSFQFSTKLKNNIIKNINLKK